METNGGALPLSEPHPAKGLIPTALSTDRWKREGLCPSRTLPTKGLRASGHQYLALSVTAPEARYTDERPFNAHHQKPAFQSALHFGGVVWRGRAPPFFSITGHQTGPLAKGPLDTLNWHRARRASRHSDSPPRPTPGIGFQRPTGLWWGEFERGKAPLVPTAQQKEPLAKPLAHRAKQEDAAGRPPNDIANRWRRPAPGRHTRIRSSGPTSAIVFTPISARSRWISSCNRSIARSTPGWPRRHAAQSIGRPTKTKAAPSA